MNGKDGLPQSVSVDLGDVLTIKSHLGFSTYYRFFINDKEIYRGIYSTSSAVYYIQGCTIDGIMYDDVGYDVIVDEITIKSSLIVDCNWVYQDLSGDY